MKMIAHGGRGRADPGKGHRPCPQAAVLRGSWPLALLLAGGLSLGPAWLPAETVLVPNGNFEQADLANPAKPARWDKPDGLGVQWIEAPQGGDSKSRGKAIRMNTAISEKDMVAQWKKMDMDQWNIPKPAGNAIAETYGLSFYSDPIPVKQGQAYLITFDYKGPSGGAKVWVRGWGQFQGEKRRRWETIVNCRTKGNNWTAFSQEFFPTKARPEVTEMRVMLYAYYPPGEYWFDNVRIQEINLETYEQLRGGGGPPGKPNQ